VWDFDGHAACASCDDSHGLCELRVF